MPRIYSAYQLSAHYLEARQNNNADWLALSALSEKLNGLAGPDAPEGIQRLAAYLTNAQNYMDDFGYAGSEEARQEVFPNLGENMHRAFNYLENLKKNYPDYYAQVQDDVEKVLNVNVTLGQKTLASVGEKKSAAKWIEDFKLEAKKGQPVDAMTVAKIFAARELANAIRGKRGNIDAKQLTEAEINAKAGQILNSELFKEYLKQNPVTAERVRERGHGGKLEMAYDAFIKAREDVQDLDSRLYGRHQYQFKCGSYTEFIQKYAWDEKKFKNASEDERMQQAAFMAVASEMTRQHPEKKFNEINLTRKATKLMQEPSFRMAMMKPGLMQELAGGNAANFNEAFGGIENDFNIEENVPSGPTIENVDFLLKKLGGHPVFTVEETRQRYARHQEDLDRLDEQIEEATSVYDGLTDDDKDLLRVVATDKELQKQFGKKTIGLRHAKEEREKRIARFNSTYEAQKEAIRNNKELSDQEKQEQMKEIDTARENELKRGRELRNSLDAAVKKLDKAENEKSKILGKAGLLNTKDYRKNFEKNEKAYLKSRGPKYRKMFEAVKNYSEKASIDDLEEKDVKEAVASILEYQNGKEKATGAQRERVDVSMQTLAQITIGTPNEKILDQQIEKINAARGLQPGQPGALSKEGFKAMFVDEEQIFKDNKEFLDKISNFSFREPKNEEENEEKEENNINQAGERKSEGLNLI